MRNTLGPVSRRDIMLGGAAAGFLAAGRIGPAQAAAPPLKAPAPFWYRFKVGAFEATVVSDGPLAIGKPEDTFKGLPKEDLERLLVANFLPPDSVSLEQNALVLNTGRNLVLFDTGLGTTKGFGDNTGHLLESLRASGIDPAQIDAICLTHAHADHCWALIGDDGRPNFPNAGVFMTRADFEFWTDESNRGPPDFMPAFIAGCRRQLLPLRDRITFIEDGREVLPGIIPMFAPGHTVGHTAYVVDSGGQALVVAGDLCHHEVLLLQRPRLQFAFDTDPQQGSASRIRVFDMLATDRLQFISYHFPFPGVGHVAKAGEGYAWHPSPMKMTL